MTVIDTVKKLMYVKTILSLSHDMLGYIRMKFVEFYNNETCYITIIINSVSLLTEIPRRDISEKEAR